MAIRFTRRESLQFLAGTAMAGLLPGLALGQAAVDPAVAPPPTPPPLPIAMIGKVGDKFFDGARQGGEQAATESGGTLVFTYLVPSDPGNPAQIKLVESLLAAKPAERVGAIVIAAGDLRALAPVCRKAMRRGIKVVSFQSPVAPEARNLHVAPSSLAMIGTTLTKLMADAIDKTGEVAILSTSATADNQNAQIAAMMREWVKPDYSGMKLLATLYGGDKADASYSEVEKLLKTHPTLKGVVALTPTASLAAAKAVADAGLSGKVSVTGFAKPSEMKPALDNGAVKSFAYWNPIDLGYAATVLAAASVKGEIKSAKPGALLHAGRLGDIAVDEKGEAVVPGPFVYDKSNIETFAGLF